MADMSPPWEVGMVGGEKGTAPTHHLQQEAAAPHPPRDCQQLICPPLSFSPAHIPYSV